MTKEMKIVIFSLVLLLTVGFATVVSDVLINGNSTVAYDANNFQVLFTNANVEGSGAATIIEDGNAISYTPSTLNNTNDTATVTYNIANNSSLYDANVNLVMKVYDENNVEVDPTNLFTIEHTQGDEEVVAKTLSEGSFTITLVGDPGEHSYRFVLTKELEAVERTSIAEGDVIPPGIEITFDPNGGKTLTVEKKNVMYNSTYGTLPITTALGQAFEGWYTEPTGGTKVTSDTVITNTADHTLYAHYQDPVALCDGYGYMKLQEAVNNAYTDGTLSEIELLKDTTETFNIDSSKVINMDLNNHTVTNPTTNLFTFSNHGNLTIVDGIINATTAGGYYNNNQMIASNLTVSSSHNGVRNISPGVLTINNNTIETTTNAAINNQSALTINGGSYISKGTGSYAIQQNTTATVEITDGYFNSNNGYIMNNQGGTATINGGTFENLSTSTYGLLTSTGTTTINGGTFTNNQTAKVTFYNQSAGTLNVNGGSFTSVSTLFTNYGVMNLGENVEALNISKIVISNANGTTTVSGGHYSSNTNLISCTGGNVIVNDGTFEGLATNFPIVVNTATSKADVVINGGTFTSPGSYVIWNRASNMTVNGGTFHTLNNYVVDVSSGANMSITGGEFSNSESTTAKNILYLEGKATISGGTFNQATISPVFYVMKSGTLYVEEGANIDASTSNAIVSRGDVIINGGSISSSATTSPTITLTTPASGQEPGSLTINGGTITGVSNAIWVRAGTSNIHGGTLTTTGEKSYTIDVDSGSTVNIDGGTFNQADNSPSLINIDGTGTISGGTFNQSAEIFILHVSSTGNLTIEDGVTFEGELSNVVSNEGTLTINGGILNAYSSTYPCVVQQATGSTTINGGTIYSEKSSAIWAKGTVTINNGDISTDKAAGISQSENTTVTITGGTIYSSNNHAVKTAGGTINISGGTFTASGNNALNLTSSSTANISGGEFTTNSQSAVNVHSSSTITIDGGTMTSYGFAGLAVYESTAIVNDGEFNSTQGYGILVSTGSTATINGGKMTSDSGNALHVTYIDTNVTINGGEFTTKSGSAVRVSENATLNIKDGSIYSESGYALNIESPATVNITGGNISNASKEVIYTATDAILNVSGGTIICNNHNEYVIYGNGTITVSGGNFGQESIRPLIYGLENSNIYINEGAVLQTINSDYGSDVIKAKGNINVSGGLIEILKDGDNDNNGEGIDLTKGHLTMTGGTIKGDTHGVYVSQSGSATITGGSITAHSHVIYNSGTLLLDGDVTLTSEESSSSLVYASGGTATINDGHYYSAKSIYFWQTEGDLTLNENVVIEDAPTQILFGQREVTVNGGSYSMVTDDSDEYVFVLNNSSLVEERTVNLNNTTINSNQHLISVGHLAVVNLNGGTFTSTTENRSGAIRNDGTLNVYEGTTINGSAKNSCLIYVTARATLNLHNGSFNIGDNRLFFDVSGVINYYEDINISSINGNLLSLRGTANFYGGTYNRVSNYYFMINADEGSTLNIEDGTFTSEKGQFISNTTDSTVNLTGGSFTIPDVDSSGPIFSLSGVTNIKDDVNIQSGATKSDGIILYSGEANITGGTIHVKDTLFEVHPSSTLNITGTANISTDAGAFVYQDNLSTLETSAVINITDQNLVCNSTELSAIHIGKIADINLTNVNITSNNMYALYLTNGTTTINGGSFTTGSTAKDVIYNYGSTISLENNPSFTATASNATCIYNRAGTITIDKGTYSSNSAYFYNYGTMTIDNMTFENLPSSLINSLGNLTINSGTYSNISGPLISLGGGETHINGGVYTTGSINLNIYGANANAFVDGVAFSSSNGRIIHSQGILSLSNSTFEVTNDNPSAIAAINNHSGQLTITNSSVTSLSDSVSCVNTEGDGASLVIESGTFTSSGAFPVSIYNGNLTINGGDFIARGNASYFRGGTVILNGGKFTGGSQHYDLYKSSNSTADVTIGPNVIYTTKDW